MKYTVEIEIDLPRDRVIELFDSVDNMKHWQRGFVSFEPISGTTGQQGAKAKLVYLMGKRRIELIETITLRQLPERFDGTYDTPGMHNIVRNRFEEIAPGKTRWVSENEFVLSGFMKVMGVVMKGAFPKQSLKLMQDFKVYAETGKSVSA